jgi:hypothetical protein
MSKTCQKAFLNFSSKGPLSDELLEFVKEMEEEISGFHMTKQDVRIAAGNFFAAYNLRPSVDEIKACIMQHAEMSRVSNFAINQIAQSIYNIGEVSMKERDSIYEIEKVCKAVMKLNEDDFSKMVGVIKQQEEYNHPLKMGTVARQKQISEHNRRVLNKLIELRETILSGENI